MGRRRVALVVEDNAGLCKTLTEVAAERAELVHACGTVAEVHALCSETPDLSLDFALLDFRLPDGTGLEVLALLAKLPLLPAIVAVSGEASPEDTFLLARKGVRCFLRKPFRLEDVRAALDEAEDTAPDPVPDFRTSVGHRGIREVEAEVRRTMVAEALAKTGGSVRGAAALLGISRQHLQHIIKAFDD